MKNLLFLNIGAPEIVLILFFGLIPFGLMIFSITDIVRSQFRNSNTKLVWAIIVLLAPVLGPTLYLVLGRGKRISGTNI